MIVGLGRAWGARGVDNYYLPHLAPPPPYRFELVGRREMVEAITIWSASPQPAPLAPRSSHTGRRDKY